MKKKKLIIIITAFLAALAAAAAVFAVMHLRGTTKVDGMFPYSFQVKNNTINVKIAGEDPWDFADSGCENVTIVKNDAGSFTVCVTGFYAGPVMFLHQSENGFDYRIILNVINDNGELTVSHDSAGKLSAEQTLGEETKYPVKVTFLEQGKAEVFFPDQPNGLWETQAPENILVSGKLYKGDGIHFTVTIPEQGEYEVTFMDKVNGVSCTVSFLVDTELTVSAVSTDIGTCEKIKQEAPERKENEPEKEEEEED